MPKSSSSPARRHFEAMHRLLTIGTAMLMLFVAFQFGRLNSAHSTGERTSTISMDLSPSPSRQTIDRRYAAAATGRSH